MFIVKLKPQQQSCLVAVREAAHAAHDAEHVVVRRIDIDVGRLLVAERAILRRQSVTGESSNVRLERSRRERNVEHSVVNTREVARAAGLEVLRLEGE